jgi:filamentous hemagglutinin
MAVFRKIVSSLMLVSYIKMLVVTSFAMEQTPQFKVQIVQRLDAQQQLEGLTLNFSQKKQDADTYELVQTDFFNFLAQEFSPNVSPSSEESEAMDWHTSLLGKIVVGYDGHVTLNGTEVFGTFEIQTPGTVLLQNCSIHTLILDSYSSLLRGRNAIVTMRASHNAQGGIIVCGPQPDTIADLSLVRGHLYNAGHLRFVGENQWDLGGNAFVNYNRLYIGTDASLRIKRSLATLNLYKIRGNDLKLASSYSRWIPPTCQKPNVLQSEIDRLLTFYATAVSLATNFVEAGFIEESVLEGLKETYPFVGGIINLGRFSLKRGEFYGTQIVNHKNAVVKIKEASKFLINKFKNDGTAIIGKATTDANHYIPYLVNSARFSCASDLTLDRLKTSSSSVIQLYNAQLFDVRSPFKLYGTLQAFDGLLLKGKGENFGQMMVAHKEMDEKALLKLEIQGRLINQGTLLSTTPLMISSKGQLVNHKTIEAPTLMIEIDSIQNDGLINGDILDIVGAVVDNTKGDIHAAQKATIGVVRLKNSQGKIHAANNVLMCTADLDNKGGSISGLNRTILYIESPKFTNKGGEIGAKGITTLTFNKTSAGAELGLIKGEEINLYDRSAKQDLIVDNGILAAGKYVCIYGTSLKGTNLDFQTPCLYLYLSSWSLNDQVNCERTLWKCSPQQDLEFNHSYRTCGTFEIWLNTFKNRQEVVQEWTRLYGNQSQPLPEPKHTIRLNASIQADKGMRVYAPEATLEIPDNQQDRATELLFKDGNVDALISKLDVERGIISALDFYSAALHGHFIGRLVEDPTRIGLATFYSNRQSGASSSNIGSYNAAKSCEMFGKTVPNFYDGRHLQLLPVYINNGTALEIKNHTFLSGPMILQASLKTHDLTIADSTLSKGTACSLDIANNLFFKNGGGLQLDRVQSKAHHHYYIANGHGGYHWVLATYTHCHSDAASLEVQGKIDADRPTPLTLIGSTWYAQEITSAIQHKDSPLTCSYFQKFYDREMCDREGLLTAQYSGLTQGIGVTIAQNYHFPNPMENTYYAAPNSPHSYAVGFLRKTNNFEGAQSVFPSYKSASTGIIASTAGGSADQIMDASISTPFMLVTMGSGNLALGSPNPYYIAPKNPIQDLMAKGFNLQTTYIAPNLKELIGQAHTKQIFFKMHERFWFDSEKAEQFYRDIYDHVHIVSPTGLKKLNGPTVFSISPGFLVDRVRKSCQDTLMRGYIYDNQAIDEECVKQLHRNATEYVSQLKGDTADASQALVTLTSSLSQRWPDKPVIFYEPGSSQGVEELSPKIVFPLHMMQDARAERGGLSRINVLAILPESMTPQQMIEFYKDDPSLQRALLDHFEGHPETVTQLEHQAQRHHQRLLAYNPEGGSTDNPLSLIPSSERTVSSSLQSTSPSSAGWGTAALYATIRSKQVGVLNEGTVISQANIEADDASFISFYENVILESRKERLYRDAENFIEHIPVPARIAVQNILKIYSGQNVIMIGAQTDSGVMTHIKALADIIDVPVELLTQHIEYFRTRNKNGRIQTNTSTAVGSRHTTRGRFVMEAGHNLIAQKTAVEGRQIDMVAGNAVEFQDAHDTVTVQETFTSKGSWGKKKKCQIAEQRQTSFGVTLKADVINVTAVTGALTLTNPTFEAIETNLKAVEGLVSILLGVNTYCFSSMKSSNSSVWNRTGQRTEEHTTYARPTFTGAVNIESRESLVQMVDGQANAFFDHIKQQGGVLEKKFLAELHKSEYKKVQGPGQALMAVIAVALSIATYGTGAALAQGVGLATNATAVAMLDVAVSSVATQFTVGTLQNNFNPLKGVKTLLNKDYIRSLTVSMVTAGLTEKIGGAYGIQKPDASFIKIATNPQLLAAHFQYNLLQQTVNTAVRTTLGRESSKGAVGNLVKSAAIDTAAAFAANKIGQGYALGELNSVEQKLLNGVVGGGIGLAADSKDPLKGALAGASSAIFSLLLAESIAGDQESLTQIARDDVQREGQSLTRENIDKAYSARVQSAAAWSKLGTSVFALATNQNVDIAVRAATNAIENSFSQELYLRQAESYQSLLKDQLLGYYNGRIEADQIKETISNVLRQSGASEDDIAQIMMGKVGRIIDHAGGLCRGPVTVIELASGVIYDDYLTKGLNLLSAAALAVDECAREHPYLTKFT